MSPTQSNTRAGSIPVIAGEDLSTAEGLLGVISTVSGKPVAKLPAATTDRAAYLITDGDSSGSTVALTPLSPAHNRRIRLKGACNAGDQLVMADPATAADKGKVTVLPEANGTYQLIGIAEEVGVDGQLVLVRPYLTGVRLTVSGGG